ncbi:hypothetical protein TWF569_003784 [Orbilia oligospora]|uniref:N(6)-L-threonylcarbamoyladenine synthase n=1 Tax=Orbilia oligospora TaxID=2813651 RepID=A0A7C8J4F3_ORBOL|nr:hypothetical protein TWF102_011761 [Orbilia oligospora]KAF3104561.1 hypothetical protein TWF103_006885 [Orbilia oligospora]KAF3116416.1 hypothetical protein TWF706_004056 [Orbilia oligospora]KAF3128779.1 hypothetical protein TWF594_011451 [Orbilia oligospora]KAF3151656.1 hypothetical protein TWF569_003784 [Orbilia oligospora]
MYEHMRAARFSGTVARFTSSHLRSQIKSREATLTTSFRNQRISQHQYRSQRWFTVLGVESSCDDSSVAILQIPDFGKPALSFHGKITADTTKFLGINPITAFQSHRRSLAPLIQDAIKHLPDGRKPDIVAVTRGPGMVSSLDVGLETAKGLALAWDVPLVGVNHMQAHALTVRLCRALEGNGLDNPQYPFLSLLVSGGHTMIVVSWSLTDHEVLAETIDTAVGDCIDKVARVVVPEEVVKSKKDTNYGKMLEEFAFSGGIDSKYEVSKTDLIGDRLQERYGWRLPVSLGGAKKGGHRGLMKFSFAGLRSSVDRLVDTRRKMKGDDWAEVDERKALSREVMRRCWEHLASRVILTLESLRGKDVDIETIVVSGGVASNAFLREVLRKQLDFNSFDKLDLAFPPIEFCTDNAAMIAWTGYEMYQAGYESTLDIAPFRKWSLQPLDEAIHDVEKDWEENAFGILGVSGWKRRTVD